LPDAAAADPAEALRRPSSTFTDPVLYSTAASASLSSAVKSARSRITS
jgi:hypothetical protein